MLEPRANVPRTQAHALLDRAKAGEPISAAEITRALQDTGDLCPWYRAPTKEDPDDETWSAAPTHGE